MLYSPVPFPLCGHAILIPNYMSTPENNPLPLTKTSVAAAKGFDLYAARNGYAAAEKLSYGQQAYIGFLFYAGDLARLDVQLESAPL